MLLIAAEVDLSVGASIAFAGCVGMDVTNRTGSVTLGALAAVAFAGVVGLFNGLVVTRLKVNSLIATIATMMILQGGVFLYTREAVQNRHHIPAFTDLGAGYVGPLPIPVIIAAVVFVIAFVTLRYTTFGRYLYAVGANEKAARLSGLRAERLKLIAFLVTGLLVGVAGLILASLMNAGQPTAGRGFELTVIAAVILGGTSLSGGRGTLIGTLLGVLVLKVIDNGIIILRWNQDLQMVVPGIVIILATWLDIVRRRSMHAELAPDADRRLATAGPALEMHGIGKRFPGVVALEGVDFLLARGKVHALMGENGAGKSTLIKIMAGVYGKDAGTILIDGREVALRSPRDALAEGIKVVFQEIALIPEFTVAENIFLERHPVGRAGSIDWKRIRAESAALFKRIGFDVDPAARTGAFRSASSRWSRSPAPLRMRLASSSWTSRPRR